MSDSMMEIPEEVQRLMEMFYTELPKFQADPDGYAPPPEYADQQVTPEDLDYALREMGIPEDQIAGIVNEYEANGGEYNAGSVINITFEDNSVVNQIDQSNNNYGEVHGDLDQTNTNNTVTASGDGSNAAGGEQYGATVQSGEGVNIGGSSDGVVNQGDNSGQQAGYDAHNDGDFTSGDGNLSADGASFVGSNANFGDGGHVDGTASADINTHSFNDGSVDANLEANISDSGNYSSEHSDDYTSTVTDSVSDSFNTEGAEYGGHKVDEPYEEPPVYHEEPEGYAPKAEPKYDEPHDEHDGGYDDMVDH